MRSVYCYSTKIEWMMSCKSCRSGSACEDGMCRWYIFLRASKSHDLVRQQGHVLRKVAV